MQPSYKKQGSKKKNRILDADNFVYRYASIRFWHL